MLWFSLLVTITAVASNEMKDVAESDEILSSKVDSLSERYADEYVKFVKTGIETPSLRKLTEELLTHRSEISLAQGAYETGVGDKFVVCTVCRSTMNVAIEIFRNPTDHSLAEDKKQTAKKIMLDMCARFNIYHSEVCEGYFEVHWDVFDFILENTLIDAKDACSLLPISFCKVNRPEPNWKLSINNKGQKIEGPKAEKPLKSTSDFKILHITDLHYDPEYKPGSLAVCDEPLCCQRMPSGEVAEKNLAGYWGDYHVCDAPMHMIVNTFDHIRDKHKVINYIYHTGDVIPHIGWKTTRNGNIKMLTEIEELIANKFPDIPVFPCLGNHDAHPSDMFSPEDVPEAVNTKWLYEHLYILWSRYLPPDTKDTIVKGGYYTTSPHPGFRIISLNNIDCYVQNWWLFYNTSFAKEQLNWLHDTLLGAEMAGEHVHILAHVPTGESDCWNVWSQEFSRLVERFHATISGIFNGHTHKDEMNVHFSENGHAVGIAWNAGSVTTFIGKNPNYRMYDVETKSMQVVDYETWIFNLTAANQKGFQSKPEWFKLYQFSKDFTDDLSPAGIDTLLEKMAADPKLLRKFWYYKMTAADPMIKKGCNEKCLLNTICTLSTTSSNQLDRCKALQAKLQASFSVNSIETTTSSVTHLSGIDNGVQSSVIFQMKTLILLGLLFCISVVF